MTREEALEVMNILRFGTFEEVINTREIVNEALAVAIEALRTEKICPVFSDDEVKQPCINCLKCELERPHGEWVSKPKRIQVDETDEERIFETRQEWFCSSCGKSFGLRKPEDAFCKYCGSDNRKSGEVE